MPNTWTLIANARSYRSYANGTTMTVDFRPLRHSHPRNLLSPSRPGAFAPFLWRYNVDLRRWEFWHDMLQGWASVLEAPERGSTKNRVSYVETWAEPVVDWARLRRRFR